MDHMIDNQGIRRALRWGRWMYWLLVVLIGFLLLSILQLGARVQAQKSRDRRARQVVLLGEAQALRHTAAPGWQAAARERLHQAAALASSLQLRQEVAAWITESDDASTTGIHRRLTPPRSDPGLEHLAWHPDGTALGASGHEDGWAWTTTNGVLAGPRRVVPERIPAGSTAPQLIADNLRVAQASGPVVLIRSIPDSGEVLTLPLPGRGAPRAVAVSPDRRWLAAIPGDGNSVELWDLPALRAALGTWDLDWSDARPSTLPAPPEGPEIDRNRRRVLSGAGLILLVAGVAIGTQYLLLRRYQHAEANAAARAGELRKMRESLAHADKMRAIGTVAAGVAHDFNNLLSVIQMSRQLIERALPGEAPAREHLNNIGQAVNQGRGVVRAILGYSRDTAAPPEPVPLTTFIPDLITLMRHPFLEGLEVVTEVPPGLPTPTVRRGRLEQVLMNLLINASEAMKGRGRITLAARPTETTEDGIRTPAGRGPWVAIDVIDEGIGIDPGLRSRIFEPFFSTKTAGPTPGTGLGLATVWRIAESENLGLVVADHPPRGTRFSVLVPLTPAAEPEDHA